MELALWFLLEMPAGVARELIVRKLSVEGRFRWANECLRRALTLTDSLESESFEHQAASRAAYYMRRAQQRRDESSRRLFTENVAEFCWKAARHSGHLAAQEEHGLACRHALELLRDEMSQSATENKGTNQQ